MILIIIENGNYTVYIHTNKVNGKRYVGITRQSVQERWREGKGYKYCILFDRAIKKYGWDGFDHEIFASNLTEEEAQHMEKLLIKELKTQDPEFGYNISDGGSTTKISEEGRKKLSEKMLGEKNPCFGKIYTAEERARISEQTRGERNPNYGRKHTEEERRKISEAITGRHLSEEHKRKISEYNKGRYVGRPRPEGSGKLPKKVLCVETGEVFDSIADAARAKGLYKRKSRISSVCMGKAKMCGGYHWKYYESSVSDPLTTIENAS